MILNANGTKLAGNITVNESLIFCDMTLREGEQAPGSIFTTEGRIELMRKLDDYGVNQIQICSPGLNQEMLAWAKQLCAIPTRANKEILTHGQGEDWKEQVNAVLDCNPDILHSNFGPCHLGKKNWNREAELALKDRVVEVTKYIKQSGKIVNISFTDAVRTDFSYLMELVEAAAQAGADRIRIADTYGIATPEAYSTLVANAVRITRPYGTIIGVHCHNDFGLALANALACVRAGARLFDVCVNGLGDRAGNVDLIELAVVLEALYGVDTGLNLKLSRELSELTVKTSHISIPRSKPLMGANVFCEEAAGHVPEQFERPVEGRSFLPGEVGMELGVLYGSMTDESCVAVTVKHSDREVPQRYYPAIVQRIHEVALEQPGVPIEKEQFWQIVDEVLASNA